jgi:hypothetical protein
MIKLTTTKFVSNNIKHINFKQIIHNSVRSKYFSVMNKNYEELKKDIGFESEEEKDLKFEDQLFFLEREMNKLIKDKIKYGQDYTTNDFPEYQKRELNSLVEIVKDFDFIERSYFDLRLKFYLDSLCETKPGKQNAILKKHNVKFEINKDEFNPNRQLLNKILSPLIPFLSSDYFMGGGAGVAAQAPQEGKEAKKEEKKEEKPQEVIFLFIILFIY